MMTSTKMRNDFFKQKEKLFLFLKNLPHLFFQGYHKLSDDLVFQIMKMKDIIQLIFEV